MTTLPSELNSDEPNTDKPSADEINFDGLSFDGLSFEEGYEELQSILAQLEAGDLALEKSLALYEKGIRLAGFCGQKLEGAELRVQRWQEGDAPTTFDGWQNE